MATSLTQKSIFELIIDEDWQTGNKAKMTIQQIKIPIQNQLGVENLSAEQSNTLQAQFNRFKKLKEQHAKQKGIDYLLTLADDDEILID